MNLLPKILLMVMISISVIMGVVSYLSIEGTRQVVNREIDRLMSNSLTFAEAKILEENQSIRRTTEIISLNPAVSKALFLLVSRGVNRVLNDLIAVYPFFHYILIIERDGNIFASSTRDNQRNRIPGERLLGRNFMENPLFPELVSEKITIGSPGDDPYLSLMGRESSMSQWFVAPIRKRGETIGWIVVSYKWQTEITQLLKQIFRQLEETGDPILETLVIDDKHIIIASAQDSLGSFDASPRKVWNIKSITFGKFPMNLVISLDSDKSNRPVTHLTQLILSISIIGSIVMIGLLYFILRQILLKRLQVFNKGTQELTDGNLTHIIPDLGRDELGHLAKTFNQMSRTLGKTVQELHEYQTTLELKVDERTRELQQTTIDLEKSMAQNRAIVETAPNGIITISERGEVQSFNSAAEEMFGYSADEITGQNISTLMPNPHRSEHDGYLRNYFQTGASTILGVGRELTGQRKNGTKFPIYLAVSEARIENESLFTGIIIDITKRKEAEEIIRESEVTLQSTLSSIDDLVFSVDRAGIFLEYRQPVSEKLFVAPELFVGKPYRDILPPDIVDALDEAIDTVISERTVEQLDYLLEMRGNSYWFTAKISPRLNMENQVVGATIVSRDVTERRQKEEEIRQAKEDAEENAEKLNQFARELELNNIELEMARIDAEAANTAKSEFLANMSHEIRTPLNAVIGFSELLGNLVVDKKQKSYLDSIQTSGNSLMTLINDILDLSKIEAGKMALNYENMSMDLVCNEIRQIFSLKISEKNLDFEIELDPDIPTFLVLDEIRLRQILLNLVGNAVKFTEKGTITISISQENKHSAQSKLDLIIAVSDTGIGIPEPQRDLIFDSFKQQEGQSNRKFGGTGLGLTITKRLIEMMNGKVSVESTVGVGTTFYVRLNEVAISAVSSIPTAQVTKETSADIAFENSLVLMVDDIPSNRQLIHETLTRVGLQVIEAENGLQSLAMAEKSRPDLVIMDIRMPVMDGYEATRKLRSNPKTKHIPIIALTASVEVEEKSKAIKLGFDGFLAKPIQSQLLIKELAHHLKLSQKEKTVAGEGTEQEGPSTKETAEQIGQLPTLLEVLRTEITPKWQELQGAMDMEEIRDFADRLLQLAQKHGATHLETSASDMINHLDYFDIAGIESALKALPAEISALEKLQ